MPVPSTPIAIAAVGQAGVVPCPLNASAGGEWECRLDNFSQFALQIGVSGQSATYLMPNGSMVVGAKQGPAEVSYTVVSQVGASPTGSQQSALFATWAQAPDSVPIHMGSPGSGGSPLLNLLNFIIDTGATFSVTAGSVLTFPGTDVIILSFIADSGQNLREVLTEFDGVSDGINTSFVVDGGGTFAHN